MKRKPLYLTLFICINAAVAVSLRLPLPANIRFLLDLSPVLLLLPATVLLFKTEYKRVWQTIKAARLTDWKNWVGRATLYFLFAGLLYYVTVVVASVLPDSWDYTPFFSLKYPLAYTPFMYGFSTVIPAMLAPFLEEFAFRYCLIDPESKYVNWQIAGSTILFSLGHLPAAMMASVIGGLVVGPVFGLIYKHTRHIENTILLHFLLNFIGVFGSV